MGGGLKVINDEYLNNDYMIEDNNNFCIYCGAPVDSTQKFCIQCGNPVYRKKQEIKKLSSEYDSKIDELVNDYDSKQKRASELVEKLFEPNHNTYNHFMDIITKSNNLFEIQVDISKKMIDLNIDKYPFVEREIKEKINTLQEFVDKMEELIDELVIQISSNKEDDEDLKNLFREMDDLIGSVKDYR